MSEVLTLGSLFDGSGGFPVAAKICGIKPIWASEVEPFPIRVTTKRMPEIKHYGDISEMDGAKIDPVDIITFGSPCQDLSIAGKREGIEGARSNLFYEAMRIIRQMKGATNDKYPRYAIWENVPGAFSSNKGADFLRVLQEFANCAQTDVTIPRPKKWARGGIVAGMWSLAWRQLDAQFWGVPQRRKRVFIVADFTGQRAPKILFKSESMPGNYKQVQKTWERFTGRIGSCTKETSSNVEYWWNHGQSDYYKKQKSIANTVLASYGMGGSTKPFVINDYGGYRMCMTKDKTNTLRAKSDPAPCTLQVRSGCEGGGKGALVAKDMSATLNTGNTQYLIDKIVRKLTPTECARLQGFPDWWCEDLAEENPSEDEMTFWRKVFNTYGRINGHKKQKTDKQIRKWLANPHTDSAEYKMWGNGVALPCVIRVLCNI